MKFQTKRQVRRERDAYAVGMMQNLGNLFAQMSETEELAEKLEQSESARENFHAALKENFRSGYRTGLYEGLWQAIDRISPLLPAQWQDDSEVQTVNADELRAALADLIQRSVQR